MNKVASLSVVLRLTSADTALASGERTPGTSMNSDDVPVLKACAVCAIEVPPDEAVVPEATDLLAYLFGFDCYARWRAAAAISFPSLSPGPD